MPYRSDQRRRSLPYRQIFPQRPSTSWSSRSSSIMRNGPLPLISSSTHGSPTRYPHLGSRPYHCRYWSSRLISISLLLLLAWAILYLPAAYLVKDPGACTSATRSMLCVTRFSELCNIISLVVFSIYSSSFRFRFPPGFAPGPQFGVGFCWYRTSFTFDEAVTEPGCRLKLASILPRH